MVRSIAHGSRGWLVFLMGEGQRVRHAQISQAYLLLVPLLLGALSLVSVLGLVFWQERHAEVRRKEAITSAIMARIIAMKLAHESPDQLSASELSPLERPSADPRDAAVRDAMRAFSLGIDQGEDRGAH